MMEKLKTISRTPAELETLFCIPKDSNARHITSGEMNDVFILDEVGLVAKFPREGAVARQTNLHEALTVAGLKHRDNAPLETPELIECSVTPPYFSLYKKVGGVTLEAQNVAKFSDKERHLLGQKMGAFVTWMTTALSFSDYDEILKDTNQLIVPNRSTILRERYRDVVFNTKIRPVIGHLICELWGMHQSLRNEGRLAPVIMGHTDLHTGNITFVQQDDVWTPSGIIDFGATQPTTPECDLRHAAILGEDIGRSAAEEYEKTTDQKLDRELIGFWAIVQMASACAYIEAYGHPSQRAERYQALRKVIAMYGETAGLDPRSYGPELLERFDS